jgi:hypothetical protein
MLSRLNKPLSPDPDVALLDDETVWIEAEE